MSAGGSDLYLGFDLLVAIDPVNLDKAESGRTIAVVSTSQIPTGQMVVDTTVHFPELGSTLLNVDRVTRKDDNVYLDAQAIAEGLFNDHMATNPLMLGAAYQAGALPISAASIERAIRLNGVSVEMNLLAFRWGRMAVVDAKRVEAAVRTATGREATVVALAPDARVLVDSVKAAAPGTELRRLLERARARADRVPGRGRTRARYVEIVEKVAQAEIGKVRGPHRPRRRRWRGTSSSSWPTRTSTRWRGCTWTPRSRPSSRARFGGAIRYTWHLHPPLLRALGLKRKLKLGPLVPARLPRALRLPPAARQRARSLRLRRGAARGARPRGRVPAAWSRRRSRRLGPDTHDAAVALAELPDHDPRLRARQARQREAVPRGGRGRCVAKVTQPA